MCISASLILLMHVPCSDAHASASNRVMSRPVGTNLILVRRVRANNLLSMKAERAKRAERQTAWGPGARSRAPGGGPGGRAPGSSWVLAFEKGPERLSWIFSLNQPTFAW